MKNKSSVIAARYIRNRATGQPFGPLVPVYEEDWPLRQISDSQIVWRYLDLWKFEDLLKTSSLHFSRLDKFRDRTEAFVGSIETFGTSKSDAAFQKSYPIKLDYETHVKSSEAARHVYFANYWNLNRTESARMWREYTEQPNPVVITSSGKALRRVLPGEIQFSPVKYVSPSEPRTEFSGESLCFYKDAELFGHERELRLLRTPLPDETFNVELEADFYRRVHVNLRLLLHRVILHKTATASAVEHIGQLVRKFCPRAKIQRSVL